MLAGSDGFGSDDGVRMVCRCHDDGICLREQFLEHHAVVAVLLGVGIGFEHVVRVLPVHVAKADDFFGLGYFRNVRGATAADTHGQNLQLAVHGRRGNVFGLGQYRFRRHGESDGSGGSCFEERSSGNFFGHKYMSVLGLISC